MKKQTIIWVALVVLLLTGFLVYAKRSDSGPGKYDQLAQCIADSGAKFYGAFWCPHCQSQKAVFGKSAKFLPYVECSSPSGSGQLQVCTDAKVEGYPTWIFKDGSKLTGEVSIPVLASTTGCVLPE